MTNPRTPNPIGAVIIVAALALLLPLLILIAAGPADAKRLNGPTADVDRHQLKIVSSRQTRKARRPAHRRFVVRLNDGSRYVTRGCATVRCPRPDAFWQQWRGKSKAFARLRGVRGKVYRTSRAEQGTVGGGVTEEKPPGPGIVIPDRSVRETGDLIRTDAVATNIAATAHCLTGCLDTVEQIIAQRSASIVGINEFCRDTDLAGFEARHPQFNVAFSHLTTAHRRCGQGGNVLAGVGLTDFAEYPLGGDKLGTPNGDKVFQLLCASTPDGMRVCVAHLRAGWAGGEGHAIRESQARVIVDTLAPHPRALLLGDLNSDPNSPALQVLGDAGFLSLDRKDRPTHGSGKTLDYVLHRGPRDSYGAAVYDQPTSDHVVVGAFWREAW